MLWRKSWRETRFMVLVFLGTALLFVVLRPVGGDQWVSILQEGAPNWSEDSRRLLPLLSSHQGYVWSYWFKLMLLIMWSMYAVAQGATLVATSCPWMAGGVGAAGLFTFSLPVSRRRVLLTHAALVGAELVLLALATSLVFPIVSHLTGADVPFGSTLVYALLLSLGGMIFPAFSFLLTVVFNNHWKVFAIGIALVFTLFIPIRLVEEYPWWNIYHVMSGETYFRYGRIPWPGLLASLAVSALMMIVAVRIYERRDF
jgi:ABC-2 type transport system permease protein